MTPFAELLIEYCNSRRILQKELAYRLGVDPSYLSAVLSGRKNIPGDAFIAKLQESLKLSDSEKDALDNAIKFSQMRYRMPLQAEPGFYEVIWTMFNSPESMKAEKLDVIRQILSL